MAEGSTADGRRCPVCGDDLSGLRPDAEVCGPECRRVRSRVRRLLAGEPDGPYRTLLDYMNTQQKTCKRPPKKPSRTDLARRFVREQTCGRSGRRIRASALHDAYVVWCQTTGLPEAPLSRSAFDRVVEGESDYEDRLLIRDGRGRPRLTFVGVGLREAA